MSGGHHHGGSDARVGVRARRWVWSAVIAAAVVTVGAVIVFWPGDTEPVVGNAAFDVELRDATVRTVEEGPCAGDAGVADPSVVEQGEAVAECRTVTAEVTSDAGQGDLAVFADVAGPNSPDIEEGDDIVVGFSPDAPPELQYYFADFQRTTPLLVLVLLFVLAVLVLGLFKGLRALVGAAASLAVLIGFLLPALLEGRAPVPLALVAASAIALLALYLTHGIRDSTHVAYLGTLSSLILTGVLAAVFVDLAHISGLSDEEAIFLQLSADQIDVVGLLLAGIIIGALGVLDDVTVTQVSAVAQLRAAQPDAGRREVYRGALEIGRDHIASTVNTLVLAYAGASLPLLLLFTQANQSFGDVVNGEVVAVEIIRALVGSIGLVASVPITTGLAVLVLRAADEEDDEDEVGAGDVPHEGDVPDDEAGTSAPDAGADDGAQAATWDDFSPESRDF